MQDKILECPKCHSLDTEISYNHKHRKFTLQCFQCGSFYKITKEEANIKCPECGSLDILYGEIETICNGCKLVLSGPPPVYVGYSRVVYDFGIQL